MEIDYRINEPLKTEDIIDVFISSGLKRPTHDKERIEKMFANSNLIISAWHNNILIGVARSLTDFSYSCYLADLAVRKEFQNKGVGKKLIEITKNEAGNSSHLLLLSAPAAMEYYSKTGFDKVTNAFIIKRSN